MACPFACHQRAIVESRYVLESTDGPIEHIIVTCLAGHAFNGPVYLLRTVF